MSGCVGQQVYVGGGWVRVQVRRGERSGPTGCGVQQDLDAESPIPRCSIMKYTFRFELNTVYSGYSDHVYTCVL